MSDAADLDKGGRELGTGRIPGKKEARGERRGGITSGPVVAAGLLLVGDAPGAALPPTFVEVCRVRHRPLLLDICRGLRCVS